MSNDKFNEHLLGKLTNFNESEEKEIDFPTEFFEPPIYSLLIIISILYAFSYTFLSFAMLTSVCHLLNISIYTNLISGISILTGVTYAIISNYESDRLVKYFAHKENFTLKQKILLIVFAILGLGIAFIGLAMFIGALSGESKSSSESILQKGYYTVNSSSVTAYTAVKNDQIIAITNTNPITITLPASAATGDEVTIIDGGNFFASNNLTVNRNSHKINAGTSNLVLNVNGQAVTLLYVNVTVGWVLKSTNQ